jgi:hypothetical protein
MLQLLPARGSIGRRFRRRRIVENARGLELRLQYREFFGLDHMCLPMLRIRDQFDAVAVLIHLMHTKLAKLRTFCSFIGR